MFCKVNLIGRVTRDAEPSKAQGATAFSVAYENGKDKQGEKIVCFVDCITFGKQAQNALLYLKKGSLVYIDGSLSITSYEDKQGIKRKGVSIVVGMFRILSAKDSAKPAFKQTPKPQLDMPVSDDFSGEMPF